MSTYKDKGKDLLKHGWHPEKPGTTLKGQIKGLVGRGDDKEKTTHTARPLASLKDPASFGPPPVRRNIATPPPLPGTSATVPPPTEQQEQEPKSPPKPYKVDTTGLSTSHLPPPPVRRDGSNVLPPPAPPPVTSRPGSGTGAGAGLPPSLPPRLPPRSRAGSTSPSTTTALAPPPPPPPPARTSTPDSNTGFLNQGALNRLGSAGISVPGLGIGSGTYKPSATASPPPPPRPSSSSHTQPQSQISELQSRFSRLGRSSSTSNGSVGGPETVPAPGASASASGGTTWAQKQAALKTASSFRQDPASVSLSDAKSAASTFQNFHQRHGDQVAAGVRGAGRLHDRYAGGVTTTSGEGQTHTEGPGSRPSPSPVSVSVSGLSSMAGSLVNKKKPPPPPPPKKKGLVGSGGGGGAAGQQGGDSGVGAPPPVPLGTRPQF